MTACPGMEPGPHWWDASELTTAPFLLPKFSRRREITASLLILCNISNTRKRVSSDINTLRSRLKKRGAADFFKRLRGVGYLMKHSFECLMWLLK